MKAQLPVEKGTLIIEFIFNDNFHSINKDEWANFKLFLYYDYMRFERTINLRKLDMEKLLNIIKQESNVNDFNLNIDSGDDMTILFSGQDNILLININQYSNNRKEFTMNINYEYLEWGLDNFIKDIDEMIHIIWNM